MMKRFNRGWFVASAAPAAMSTSMRFASGKALPVPNWVDSLRDDAKKAEKNISYDIKIYSELAWRKKKFTFDREAWDPINMTAIQRNRLCLGDEEKEYTVIGEAFPFPDREDSPVVNEPNFPCKLLWDHTSPTEKILIQISEHTPPLLWITVKPQLASLKRIFSEFIDVDAQHMKKHLPYYEEVQSSLENRADEKFGDTLSNMSMKDRFIEDMRKRDPRSVGLDWPQEHSVYLGNVEHFRLAEDGFMKTNPFTFGWPLLVGDGNHHLEETPLRMAAFRTIYSKSMIMLHTRMDLQLDHRQVAINPDTDEDTIMLEMPLFATLNYPVNSRMCGGAQLVQRYNKVMGTSYPLDMPIDLIGALAKHNVCKGPAELMEELNFLDASSKKVPDVERVIRISEDMMSTNRIIGQLAYTIVHLAIVGHDRFVEDVFENYKTHPSDLVRVACAKGAQAFAREDLIHEMIAKEPEGRCKRLLQITAATQVTSSPGPADDAPVA